MIRSERPSQAQLRRGEFAAWGPAPYTKGAASAVAAALEYAERGWPVFPMGADGRRKFAFTEHGVSDATRDPTAIRRWFARWPKAQAAIATGKISGVVALDIDVDGRLNGFDSLEEIGAGFHPITPTAHTPRGGCHLLFAWPGYFVKTIAGRIGTALDIRADGGSLILPPGPGRWWDPILGPALPLAPMPAWMAIAEPVTQPRAIAARPRVQQPLSRYGEVALDNAVKRIIGAPPGAQETTLNTESYSIGRLARDGQIPAGLAIDALIWAATQIPSIDPRYPWRASDLEQKTRRAFADGLAQGA